MLQRPQAVALGSLAIGVLIVAGKLAAGIGTGSLALIGDAVHSLLDVVSSGFALIAVRTAAKPADVEHPFGHGRAETLSAFAEGILLILTALGIAYEALSRLLRAGGGQVDPAYYAMALLVGTIVVEGGRGAILSRVGRESGSEALTADAANRGADVLSSLGVLIGLIAVRIGFRWADPVAALGVAGLIGWIAGRLVWHSGDILMDRSPIGIEQAVRGTIATVKGVREVRSVRIRRSGASLIGDASISARPSLPVEGAQALTEDVRRVVGAGHPNLQLTLVIESDIRADNMVERVHAVAARHGGVHDLHNVTVEREEDGSLHLTMHAKMPAQETLTDAARAAAQLERGLRDEFPQVSRVDVHLEPLEPDVIRGENVTDRRSELADGIRRLVEEHRDVTHCRDVELSSRAGMITAHVVVEMSGALTLVHAHQVETALEARLLTNFGGLTEVVVRATS